MTELLYPYSHIYEIASSKDTTTKTIADKITVPAILAIIFAPMVQMTHPQIQNSRVRIAECAVK
jgi:hypothetical protein